MSTWPDRDGAAIDRYVRQIGFRHPKTATIYRRELIRFQRFIVDRDPSFDLAFEDIAAWLRERAAHWPMHLLLDRACKVNCFLSFLVTQRSIASQPFELLRSRLGVRGVSPIVRALLADDPEAALEALKRPQRFGSFLGPLMREHVEMMRSMGYRFDSQAQRFEGFDRFLQSRPDLTDRSLPALVREWSAVVPTPEHRWHCHKLGRDLTRAWRRIDPTVEGTAIDRDLRRQVEQQRRRPYIYTPQEICQLLDAARALPSPRAPLRPLTAYTMLVLAYCAGLRLGEIIRLDIRDVHFDEGAIEIRNTKFFKSRRLPLSTSVLAALQEYREARANAGGPQQCAAPFFWRQTRQGGGRYARATVEGFLVRVLRLTGLKPPQGTCGPRIHDLRHAFVCHRMLEWYRDGVEPQSRLPYLATYLGHRDINSTLVYLTVTQELLQLAGERFRTYAHSAVDAAHGRVS
jgi:integrase/recombinase XerD